MKKYAAVAKILFKTQIMYRFDVLMTGLGAFWKIIFAWVLWGAIYAGRARVGSFTLEAMLSYYVIGAFLTTLDMSYSLCGEVSERIKNGTFSKYMVIPSNPQIYFISQTFGAGGYYGIFAVLATALSALAFRIKPVFSGEPANIILAVVICLLGLVFMNSFHYFLGLWAFKLQDVTFIMHVLPAVISFFKGEYVPLSLLPTGFTYALRFFPFAHVIYTPVMLLIGEIGLREGLFGLAVLAAWTLASFAAGQFTYNRLRVKYEGVGI